MSEKLKTIIPKARVQETIDEIADRINRDYDGQPVHLIGVLRGAAYFLCNLSLRLTMPVTMDFVRVESYEGTDPGHLKNIMGLSESLKDKNVIIVEDIVDSGQTLNYLKALLITEDPKASKSARSSTSPVDVQSNWSLIMRAQKSLTFSSLDLGWITNSVIVICLMSLSYSLNNCNQTWFRPLAPC